jgi:hypothetical protein
MNQISVKFELQLLLHLKEEASMYNAARRETPHIQHTTTVFALAHHVWVLRCTQFCLVTVPNRRKAHSLLKIQ